jgi:hypothetical protein
MSGRRIEARTRGQQHGFIRRMVSPGDPISERIKPFVFLEDTAGQEGMVQATGLE